MTTTYSDIVNEILINMAGYTMQQDRATSLSSAVTTTTTTTISVSSTSDIGKGIVEIGEELLWVENFDRVANTLTVAPWCRGYLGTTPSTAATSSKVTISPTFPRSVIKRAINDTIRAMGASIFAVKQTTFTFNPAVTTYELDNLNIQNNVISTSHKYNVKKLMFFASSCIYSKNCSMPIQEQDLLTGELEKSNEFYAIANIVTGKQIGRAHV